MPYPRGHGLAVPDMPDARRYAGQEAKDMPTARYALAILARAGDTWPGDRDDGASPESGGIRMSPTLGQGISQTERAIISKSDSCTSPFAHFEIAFQELEV